MNFILYENTLPFKIINARKAKRIKAFLKKLILVENDSLFFINNLL